MMEHFILSNKAVENINKYKKIIKKLLFFDFFGVILVSICLFIGFIYGKNNSVFEERLTDIEFYILMGGAILAIGLLLIDIVRKIILINNINKDIESKQVEAIFDTPCNYSVIFNIFNDDKSLINNGYLIKLYFSNDRIKLKVIHCFKVHKRRNLYEAVDEKIYFNKYKLKYLPKSKIVVDGDEAIKALFKDRYY